MKQLRRIKFTPGGYKKLQEEQVALKLERKDAVESLRRARELGDLSENGLYKAARMRLTGIDHRIRRISFNLKLADVIEHASSDKVGIGSKVTVNDGENNTTYEIVGDLEADPKNMKISLNSPLGRALDGKKPQDTVVVQTPTRTTTVTIKTIS